MTPPATSDGRVAAEKLLELAEACEKASGPDRKLDAAIWWAVHQNAETDAQWRPKFEADAALACDELWGREWRRAKYLKFYTASLDAAMTLVPEGWFVTIIRDPGGIGYAGVAGHPDECGQPCATPALALTAAAIRARAEGVRHDG